MQTMHPVVLHGCTTWDQERFPIDEFAERLRSVQTIIKDNELKGLIIYSDCRNYAKLCYLTNYIPKHSWAMLLVPANGNPRLLANVAGTRDIPAVRILTWLEDIRPAKNIAGEVSQFVEQITEGQLAGSGKETIGICGVEEMRHSVYKEIVSGCGQHVMKNMDPLFERLLLQKRPREVAVMRETCNLLKSAANAMRESHRRGGSVVTAVIEAERVARYMGAQDVRVLYSLDSGHSLQPFDTLSEVRNDPMIAYIAVQYLGYWAEAMISITRKESPAYHKAVKLLEFFQTSLRPDSKIHELVHQGLAIAKPYQLHVVANGRFGHSIGLSLEEKPFLDLSCGEGKIEDGTLYSVHATLTDNKQENVMLSTMVLVKRNGNEILWSSV